MTIKDALLYISPVDGDEVTARFAAGLAQHFGAEVTGLTFAFDVTYPTTFIHAYSKNRFRSYERRIAKTLLLR